MTIKITPHKKNTTGVGAGVISYNDGDILWRNGETGKNGSRKEANGINENYHFSVVREKPE